MDSNNVSYGKPKVGGAVFWAPLGTTLPKDSTSALTEEFKNLGYTNEDGVANEISTEEEVKAWGDDIVLTKKLDTFKMTLLEATNVDVLKLVFGSTNVTGTLETGITIAANSDLQEQGVMVVDMILKGGILKRVVIPKAAVSEVGETVYGNEDPIGYEVTLVGALDESGNSHYEYIQKKNTVVGG
ncbi:MAG: phage tail protein [Anaerovoracaceae bacterium]